jgi:choline dehydrogenase-like flavoprotein
MICGAHQDYDLWQELGNAGWSWEDVFPYFLRAENQERGASRFHSTGGPLNVADLRFVSPLSNGFVEGACGSAFNRMTTSMEARNSAPASPLGVGLVGCLIKVISDDSATEWNSVLQSGAQRRNALLLSGSVSFSQRRVC